MKKFLALFLALLMCVGILASCGGGETDTALDEAKEFLDTMMEDKKGKELANDYKVPGKLVVGDAEFEVTWETDNKDIKIKESSEEGFWTVDLPNVNAKLVEYKLIATIKDADGKTIEATFTLKLPVIDDAGRETEFKADVEYKAYIKQVNLGYDLYVLNTTQDNANKFINTTMDPKEAAVFNFEIVEGGYKIYTTINGVKNYLHATATPKADKPDSYTKTIGFAETTDCVFTYDSALSLFKIKLNGVEFGVGTYGTYETISLSEMKHFKADNINVKEGQFPMGFMTKAHADTLDPSTKPVDNDPKADTTLSIADAIALGNTKVKDQYTKGKYYIEGTIKEIQNEQYGNLVITDGTNDLLVYGTYSADGKVSFADFAVKPKVGDKIKVYGIIGKYNDAQMKYGWIVEGLPEGAVPSTPSTPSTPSDKTEVVTTPVAGTAYKFGMVQTKAGKTVYLKGGMNGFYMETTTNPAEAIDVYLEATTNGYYFYTKSGDTKQYINLIITVDSSDATKRHVNAAYENAASTVYTIDATNKTLITHVEVTEYTSKTGDYVFGTRNDKTYTTVGAVFADASKSFICQFYTIVEGGTETPDTPACTEHKDENGDNVCDTEGCDVVVEPAADSTLTLPQANTLGTALKGEDSTNKYTVIGTIVDVEDVSSGKMTIKDENDVTLYVYKVAGWADMDEKPVAGDVITLYGIIGSYNSVAQIENAEMKALQHTHAYDVNNQGKCPCGAVDPDFKANHECADGDDEDFICDNADCNVVIKPAADSVLTVKQALALAGLLGADEYTENKYYVTGVITGITNATDGRFSIKADESTMDIYKAFSADGSKQFNAMDVVPVKGDTVTVYGIIGNYKSAPQMKEVWITNVVVHEHAYSDATCTAPKTCKLCGATEGEVAGHNYGEGDTCTVCGNTKPVPGSTLATFDFGEKVAEGSHSDGTEIASGKQYTDGNYTLTINSATKVYDGANDLKGNTCLKLGTGKLVGSFEFTVGEDVNKVIIKVAQYKSNATTITVNGAEHVITTASDNGEYTSIEVDTSENKTITFVATTKRAMIDAIIFVA